MGRSVATLRVLVVDDDVEFREAIAGALGESTQVSCAATPGEALWMLAHGSFDVLICDLFLSTSANGDDVLEAVRAEWPRIVRILITGHGERLYAAPHAAHAVLAKPCDLDALRDLLTWVAAAEKPAAAADPVSA